MERIGGDPVTTTPEPSDATRFATRPKQRKAEVTNATDNEQAADRKKTVTKTLMRLREADRGEAYLEMVAGMWRQYGNEDDRTLDPETVAEQFTAATERHETDIRRRAVLAQHGIRST
jgi:hypothetical protein